MTSWKTIPATLLSLSLLSASAQAASLCTSPDEMAALRTAAVQQELMVAGLTCQASDAYNRFVLAYRPELQKSDADLKAYFLRREGARGEAAYDTFKTKLANLSSFSDVTNGNYCANTRAAFALALERHQSLASFVADQRLMIALPEQQLCAAEPANAPMIAASAPAPVKLATATPIAVSGVPQHSVPASPFGIAPPPRVSAPPPAPATYPPQQSYQEQDNDQDYDEDDNGPDVAPIPPALQRPQRPAMIEAQRGPYGTAGWPPNWGPQPYGRGYAPAPYPYPYYYYGR
jgi:hypothetical protein